MENSDISIHLHPLKNGLSEFDRFERVLKNDVKVLRTTGAQEATLHYWVSLAVAVRTFALVQIDDELSDILIQSYPSSHGQYAELPRLVDLPSDNVFSRHRCARIAHGLADHGEITEV